jgi:hypothetical protein
LNYKLVLEVLARSTNSCGGVFEDEFRVTFGGERSDEVELTLWQLDQRFFGGIAEDQLANYSKVSNRVKAIISPDASRACLVDAIEG